MTNDETRIIDRGRVGMGEHTDYAAPDTPPLSPGALRTSRLALLSLLWSIGTCPVFVVLLVNSPEIRPRILGDGRVIDWPPLYLAPAVGVGLGIGAFVQLWRSRRGRGHVFAAMGILLSVIWLLALFGLRHLMLNAHFGPAD